MSHAPDPNDDDDIAAVAAFLDVHEARAARLAFWRASLPHVVHNAVRDMLARRSGVPADQVPEGVIAHVAKGLEQKALEELALHEAMAERDATGARLQ